MNARKRSPGIAPVLNARKTFVAIAALLVGLSASRIARATPDFPAAVEQALMIPAGTIASKVDPPDGCHLCHVNGSAGGDPLTSFGNLMKANGAVEYEASGTAGPAIAVIEAMDPRFIADIKNGMDPNRDPNAASTNTDPAPQYGCGSIAPGMPRAPAGGAIVGVLALASRRGRRRRRA
jgi:hypothetical protein